MDTKMKPDILTGSVKTADTSTGANEAFFSIHLPARITNSVSLLCGINVEVENPAFTDVTHTEWIFDTENVVSEYYLGYGKGEITHFHHSPIELEPRYYFTAPGTFNLNVRFEASCFDPAIAKWVPKEARATVVFTVVAPQVAGLIVCSNPPEVYERAGEQVVALGLCNEDIDTFIPGFLMTANIRRPAECGAGELKALQLVKPFRRLVRPNGQVLPYIKTKFVVDRDDDMPFYGRPGDRLLSTTSMTRDDSPEQTWDPGYPMATFEWKDQYKLYFMYKVDSDTSIWVTLCRYDWGVDILYQAAHGFVRAFYPNQGATREIGERYHDLPEFDEATEEKMTRQGLLPSRKYEHNSELFLVLLDSQYESAEAAIEQATARKPCLGYFKYNNNFYTIFWGPKELLTGSNLKIKDIIKYPRDLQMKDADLTPDHDKDHPHYIFNIKVAPFCFPAPSRNYWDQFAYAGGYSGFGDQDNYTFGNYINNIRKLFNMDKTTFDTSKFGEVLITTSELPDFIQINQVAGSPQTVSIERRFLSI